MRHLTYIIKMGTMLVMMASIWGISGLLSAQEVVEDKASLDALTDLMRAMPQVRIPRPQAVAQPERGEQFLSGLYLSPGRIVMDGRAIFDRGPEDGLEVVFCFQDGKLHEALASSPMTGAKAQGVKMAFIVAFDLHDGAVSPESSGQPVRGTPLQVRWYWQRTDPLTGDQEWIGTHASTLVRSRSLDRAYPPLPYMYTGSQIRVVHAVLPDGSSRRDERFMLQDTKSLVVNHDEPDALIASPFPLSARDHDFEVFSGAPAPPPGTAIQVVFERAELPLMLAADKDGDTVVLRHDDQTLSDAALQELLAAHYGSEQPSDLLRAVGILVDPELPRRHDLTLRRHVMAQAVEARVWVVPVFVQRPPEDDVPAP